MRGYQLVEHDLNGGIRHVHAQAIAQTGEDHVGGLENRWGRDTDGCQWACAYSADDLAEYQDQKLESFESAFVHPVSYDHSHNVQLSQQLHRLSMLQWSAEQLETGGGHRFLQRMCLGLLGNKKACNRFSRIVNDVRSMWNQVRDLQYALTS